jgi:hypothetical protein
MRAKDALDELYSVITKYYLSSLIVYLKLQSLSSHTAVIFLLSLNIALVALPAQAQPPFNEEKRQWDGNTLFLLNQLEYTFDIDGTQIFPNNTLKHSILTEYKESVYSIPHLQYELFGHTINASDVQIHLNPTRIDDTRTRFDIQIHANNTEVRGQWLNKSFRNVDLNSMYGIYNIVTDKMTIHVPYSVALSLLWK